MTDIPHFALPLRYVGGSAQVNEQDSMDDIATCVEAICLTEPGFRLELPEFGIEDPTFGQQPLPTAAIVSQIQTFEPRVSILVDEAPDLLDTAIVNIGVNMVVAQ